jgi:TM2 domain-containing membrane protein YozV
MSLTEKEERTLWGQTLAILIMAFTIIVLIFALFGAYADVARAKKVEGAYEQQLIGLMRVMEQIGPVDMTLHPPTLPEEE